MKRSPELRNLSVDHHHGLLLARKAKLVAAGQDDTPLPDMWKEAEEKFRFELEPHFRIEEEVLGPALHAHGEIALVQRLHREHEELRGTIKPGADRTPASLANFGELLERHIRFEERELFETAQRVLNPDELSAVAVACQARYS